MTPKDIAEARKIIDAATPGPWKAVTQGEIRLYDSNGVPLIDANDSYLPPDDATFIAAARSLWPLALDRVEKLGQIVEADFIYIRGTEARLITAEQEISKLKENHPNAVLMLANENLRKERDQLLEALELKDKLIAHQREQHAAREKILVEALIHIACLKRLDRYNCTLETTREFARETLVKLQANE